MFLIFFLMAGDNVMAFALKSKSFKDGQFIDKKFSCEGENISPNLEWTNAPQGTKSFALIVDDPDAPRKDPWVHWIIFNIPGDVTNLSENVSNELGRYTELKTAFQGTNDFKKNTYGGPCPPAGKPHRYFFKLYALDQILPVKSATKEQLLTAMEGHILAEAKLIGLFQID